MKRLVFVSIVLVAFVAAPVVAQAGQCSWYTGTSYPAAKVIVPSADSAFSVTFCSGSAGYTSDSYLYSPDFQWVGTGHHTPVGTEFDLGVFAEGTELVFAIYVRNTGRWYFTGPGSRNPDGQVHAAVRAIPGQPNAWRIGFEDLWGGGDRDYDDINLVLEGDLIVVPPTPTDTDQDGIPDYSDNCIFVPNPDQIDLDNNGIGDACEISDEDEDGVPDEDDNCPSIANEDQSDLDDDGLGDVCDECPLDFDNDADADGVCGNEDNCPAIANSDQSDLDEDGFGDVCDDCTDVDADGVCIEDDLCAGTMLPEGVPTVKLGTWRWADIDGDGVFDTTESKGKGPKRSYNIENTGGCSCEQIIVALDLGQGHTKFGCSISAMDDWTAIVAGQ